MQEMLRIFDQLYNILCIDTGHKGQDIFVLKGLKSQYQNKPQYAHVLQREYNKCSGLHHDGVVAYLDLVDIEEKGKCIVFEYIDKYDGEKKDIHYSAQEFI